MSPIISYIVMNNRHQNKKRTGKTSPFLQINHVSIFKPIPKYPYNEFSAQKAKIYDDLRRQFRQHKTRVLTLFGLDNFYRLVQ